MKVQQAQAPPPGAMSSDNSASGAPVIVPAPAQPPPGAMSSDNSASGAPVIAPAPAQPPPGAMSSDNSASRAPVIAPAPAPSSIDLVPNKAAAFEVSGAGRDDFNGIYMP